MAELKKKADREANRAVYKEKKRSNRRIKMLEERVKKVMSNKRNLDAKVKDLTTNNGCEKRTNKALYGRLITAETTVTKLEKHLDKANTVHGVLSKEKQTNLQNKYDFAIFMPPRVNAVEILPRRQRRRRACLSRRFCVTISSGGVGRTGCASATVLFFPVLLLLLQFCCRCFDSILNVGTEQCKNRSLVLQ
mmetsp:Transcript_26271/g.31776  ORF Transcript_26271/g.31776 Transcript_26271/m.31776 type:complete len:192 (-) Transcript_26271:913-1488(-)